MEKLTLCTFLLLSLAWIVASQGGGSTQQATYLAPGGQASQTGAQTTGGGGAAAFLPPGGQAPQTGTAFLQPAPGTSSLVAPRRQTNSFLSPQLLRFLIVYLLAQNLQSTTAAATAASTATVATTAAGTTVPTAYANSFVYKNCRYNIYTGTDIKTHDAAETFCPTLGTNSKLANVNVKLKADRDAIFAGVGFDKFAYVGLEDADGSDPGNAPLWLGAGAFTAEGGTAPSYINSNNPSCAYVGVVSSTNFVFASCSSGPLPYLCEWCP